MIYPGYMLNPGDMFQVEPERVLFATGAPKTKNQRRSGRRKAKEAPPSSGENSDKKVTDEDVDLDLSALSLEESATAAPPPPSDNPIAALLTRARATISSVDESSLAAKQKQALRSLKKSAKPLLSQRDSAPAFAIPALEAELSNFASLLSPPTPTDRQLVKEVTASEKAMQQTDENPVDPRKPYGTPWRPRDYMSPFAFIPRYLEVNQNICAAVYLRHPVARPGLSEVSLQF
jgi:ribosomal protein S4